MRISKDWCLNMAKLEDGAEIGAGKLAIDPVPDRECPNPKCRNGTVNERDIFGNQGRMCWRCFGTGRVPAESEERDGRE